VIMHDDTPRLLSPSNPFPTSSLPPKKRPFHLKLWFCRNPQNLSFWLPASNFCNYATMQLDSK
jgi:hypothetical protein